MDLWSSLWNVVVVFFWAFVFLAALVAFFTIAADLIRDRSLGGWAKAAWILLLVVLPLLGSLIYLIARGDSMAERAAVEQRQAKAAADDYIRSVAGHSLAEEIARAMQLRDAGAITEEEFLQIKRHALASS
ncbi:MAG: PLDc N-terminal domain-containing protein [Cellulomonas sp.]|nr:PLDc N-terminal domain-containing protein [Cellulomonas sp.]